MLPSWKLTVPLQQFREILSQSIWNDWVLGNFPRTLLNCFVWNAKQAKQIKSVLGNCVLEMHNNIFARHWDFPLYCHFLAAFLLYAFLVNAFLLNAFLQASLYLKIWELFFRSVFRCQCGVWEMHDDIFARRWDFPLCCLLLYLLGKKVGKKAAGDKPISHYFHLKLFILCGDKNFFNRIVQKLDEITADQWWRNSTFQPIIYISNLMGGLQNIC